MRNNKPVFYKFNSLNRDLINIDYQLHTNWTDGNHSAEEIIDVAKKKGLKEIAFTEHIRRDSTYFPDFFNEINHLREKENIKVYIGVETKVVDKSGNIDISESDYLRAEVVLGSVHRVNVGGRYFELRSFDKETAFKLEHEYTQALINSNNVDVLAHPGGMSYKFFNEIPEFFLKETIRTISQTKIAFEINSRYLNLIILEMILFYCKKYDPYISIGSDMHKISEVGICKEILGKYL